MPGYVGKSIEQYLWELYVACGKDKEKAERAIVFFDEIDKKGSSKKDDVSGKGVLNILLKFLDGTTYEACENGQHKSPGTYVNLDTSKMKVVLGGAFTDVYKNMKASNGIGFNGVFEDINNVKNPTMEDFVTKAMMSDEFMGRVPILIKMNDLDKEAIKRIIVESDDSALRQEEASFDEIGVKLTVTPEYLEGIAKKAFEKKTGARGINAMVTDTTWRPFDVVYRHLGDYSEVVLDGETVKDNEKFQLVKKKKDV
jgi:ATP-dependent Clp protease ATP-binding subunit ClpX